jgi:hypothetical protein
MSHPLDGCWAKIQRAKEQINNLDIEITSLLNNDAYSVVGEFQPERQRYVFRIVGPSVPLRIAVSPEKLSTISGLASIMSFGHSPAKTGFLTKLG